MTIRSRPSTKEYRDNFDRVFRKGERARELVEEIRRDVKARGLNPITEEEIAAEIRAAREERRARENKR